MSWPKLRQRWAPGRATPGRIRPDLTAEERNALWDHVGRIAVDVTAQIRARAWTDPAAAADAAWAASDTLHVAAAILGSRVLRQAADAYDRAARSPYGRVPPPTPDGNRLRQAARIMSAFAYLRGDRSLTPTVLIAKLAALAEAVAGLRESQQHAAQAAAALRAAEHLHAAACPAPAPPRPPPRASTAAQLAGLSFPAPARTVPRLSAPGQPDPDQGSARPPHRPSSPRPRGPNR